MLYFYKYARKVFKSSWKVYIFFQFNYLNELFAVSSHNRNKRIGKVNKVCSSHWKQEKWLDKCKPQSCLHQSRTWNQKFQFEMGSAQTTATPRCNVGHTLPVVGSEGKLISSPPFKVIFGIQHKWRKNWHHGAAYQVEDQRLEPPLVEETIEAGGRLVPCTTALIP